jgi:6-phosphogluconate dehydrogenase (decarboxylating)
MAKNYKVILRGQIEEGIDIEEVHEKLAIVFDIDLNKIPKLLKKPTVIRKNLTSKYALAYQIGLEKIGVPCDIEPPVETEPSLKKN